MDESIFKWDFSWILGYGLQISCVKKRYPIIESNRDKLVRHKIMSIDSNNEYIKSKTNSFLGHPF